MSIGCNRSDLQYSPLGRFPGSISLIAKVEDPGTGRGSSWTSSSFWLDTIREGLALSPSSTAAGSDRDAV